MLTACSEAGFRCASCGCEFTVVVSANMEKEDGKAGVECSHGCGGSVEVLSVGKMERVVAERVKRPSGQYYGG